MVKGEPAVVVALIWTELASKFVTVTVRVEGVPIKTAPKSSELGETLTAVAARVSS